MQRGFEYEVERKQQSVIVCVALWRIFQTNGILEFTERTGSILPKWDAIMANGSEPFMCYRTCFLTSLRRRLKQEMLHWLSGHCVEHSSYHQNNINEELKWRENIPPLNSAWVLSSNGVYAWAWFNIPKLTQCEGMTILISALNDMHKDTVHPTRFKWHLSN